MHSERTARRTTAKVAVAAVTALWILGVGCAASSGSGTGTGSATGDAPSPSGSSAGSAAVPSPATAPAAQAPPLDPTVTKGRLDNGLVYLFRENHRPENRAELRLVVKAGSVDEDEDQRGIAHFVEHMLFNGTESWAGNDIIDYFESIGARFGADLNAYTSFDETVYSITVPTDREDLLPRGVEILAEFAGKARHEQAEIEKERGVVLDEWRRGLGAGKRIRDAQLPILLKGSRYAERLPIGLPEVVEAADTTLVRRFYRDWYHPERMALVAVGDFDAADMERWVRDAFGALPSEPAARERTDWSVPVHPDTLFALADDPELRGTSVGFSVKRPPTPDEGTRADYRRDLVRRVGLQILNGRLAEVARGDDPPFLMAGVGVRPLGRRIELTSASVRVVDGGEAAGLEALAVEIRRAAAHGFLESEMGRTKRGMLAGIEATWAERGKTPSGSYASEYVRHFLRDEPIPGIDAEVELWRAEVPGIGADECHREFLALLDASGLVVEAARPTREGMAGEAELLQALRAAAARPVEPWIDAGAGGELPSGLRPPGGGRRAFRVSFGRRDRGVALQRRARLPEAHRLPG